MRPEEKKQVERCIVLPLAYQAIQIDKKEFEASYAPNPYLDLLESLAARLKRDMPKEKQRLFQNYQIFVDKLSGTTYRWRRHGEDGVLVYSEVELKTMTESMIKEYISTQGNIVSKERIWKNMNLLPPEHELPEKES